MFLGEEYLELKLLNEVPNPKAMEVSASPMSSRHPLIHPPSGSDVIGTLQKHVSDMKPPGVPKRVVVGG